MRKEIDFREDLKERLKDKEFRRGYEEERIFASIAVEIAKLREKEGITQEELARAVHTTQQNISRLEDTGNESMSLRTLLRIAQALHRKIKIQFV